MSSSYSSLDWVLSHWAHFTVHIGGVDMMGLKPNPNPNPLDLSSFSALTCLLGQLTRKNSSLI